MMLKTMAALILLLGASSSSEQTPKGTNQEDVDHSPVSEYIGSFFSDMWLDGTDMIRILWKDCSKKVYESDSTKMKKDFLQLMVKCMKKKSLTALDRTLNNDVIPLSQGVELVKYEQVNKNGNVDTRRNFTTMNFDEENIKKSEWSYLVLERMSKVFNTHVLKVDLHPAEKREDIAEFRHRRRHQMMQMMMFGIMSMGMIMVPMGFQFLAVLGGKALLLSKLALILSSIQGLKKIATSPINYGLYHSYPTSSYETNFEKRGYGIPPQTQVTYSKVVEDPQPVYETDVDDKITYRFDRQDRLWKPQGVKSTKRSIYNAEQNVYPVYAVSQANQDSSIGRNGQVYAAGYQPDETLLSDQYGNIPGTQEILAEYTIDLPVNKVQLKTSSPLLGSVS